MAVTGDDLGRGRGSEGVRTTEIDEEEGSARERWLAVGREGNSGGLGDCLGVRAEGRWRRVGTGAAAVVWGIVGASGLAGGRVSGRLVAGEVGVRHVGM